MGEKQTVTEIVVGAIRAGKSNKEALAAVKAALPNSKTTIATVSWYRQSLRRKGEQVPTAREVRALDKALDI